MNPYVVLSNLTNEPILIRESLQHSRPGSYNRTLEIGPHSQIQIPANYFDARNRYSGRGASIHLFLGQFKAHGVFTPGFFTSYLKIIFDIVPPPKEGGVSHIIIYGVTPKWTDINPFQWFGIFGRNYEGRNGKLLASWELKIPEEG